MKRSAKKQILGFLWVGWVSKNPSTKGKYENFGKTARTSKRNLNLQILQPELASLVF